MYCEKCVVEGVGMRVCKEGATWKLRGEIEVNGEDEGGKKKLTCSFLDSPQKTKPLFFNYTPKKEKSLF